MHYYYLMAFVLSCLIAISDSREYGETKRNWPLRVASNRRILRLRRKTPFIYTPSGQNQILRTHIDSIKIFVCYFFTNASRQTD